MRRSLILIVDDDQDTREAYATLFAGMGHCIATAGDGDSALTAATRLCPDLIVLDIGLPRMSGLEVLRRLRASEDVAGIPVVVLTGRVRPRYLDAARQAGSDRVLTKPCDTAVLCDAVATLLASPPYRVTRGGDTTIRLRRPSPRRLSGARVPPPPPTLEAIRSCSELLVREARELRRQGRWLGAVSSSLLKTRRVARSLRAGATWTTFASLA